MKLALFGYGGHAREVACQIGKEITFFVDDQYVPTAPNVKGISTFNPEEYVMCVIDHISLISEENNNGHKLNLRDSTHHCINL